MQVGRISISVDGMIKELSCGGFFRFFVDLCLTDYRYPISMSHLELFVSNFFLIVRVR